MATVKEAAEAFALFADGFNKVVKDTIVENKDMLEELIKEQLYSGVNGNDKPLRPTYLNDPYFKSEEAGHWQNKAKSYMMWKKKIKPPKPSFLLDLPARDEKTPNLIIKGDFYDSITAIPISDGVRISTQGTPFGDDVERKYGSAILKIGTVSRKHFIEYFIEPALKSYFSNFGL